MSASPLGAPGALISATKGAKVSSDILASLTRATGIVIERTVSPDILRSLFTHPSTTGRDRHSLDPLMLWTERTSDE